MEDTKDVPIVVAKVTDDAIVASMVEVAKVVLTEIAVTRVISAGIIKYR